MGWEIRGEIKKSRVDSFLQLDENDQIVQTFCNLGEGPVPKTLINVQLPWQIRHLEQFVCMVYSAKGPFTLPELRWELFRTRNLEGEMLPPTRGSLLPHIIHVNYVSLRDKS